MYYQSTVLLNSLYKVLSWSWVLLLACFLHSSRTRPTDEAEPMENGVDDQQQPPPQENGIDSQQPPEKPTQPEKPVRKIRVTYEEYRTIANLLILHLRQEEETSTEGESVVMETC